MRRLVLLASVTLLTLSVHADRKRSVSRPDAPIPQRIEILGWAEDAMEPFVSSDGEILLFNNSNDPAVNTDLHWARRAGELTWMYRGPLVGVNTEDLEGVPSLSESGELFFVSTRTYQLTLSTIYKGQFEDGVVTGLELLDEISRRQPGWVNFDVETTRDGNTLYFVDAQFSPLGFPVTADLVIAIRVGNRFTRLVNSDDLMANVNTPALEYAAAISEDELTLYFTRTPNVSTPPRIWKSVRSSVSEPWEPPAPVETSEGFVEAPAISGDGRHLYYHRKAGDRFVIERIPLR